MNPHVFLGHFPDSPVSDPYIRYIRSSFLLIIPFLLSLGEFTVLFLSMKQFSLVNGPSSLFISWIKN